MAAIRLRFDLHNYMGRPDNPIPIMSAGNILNLYGASWHGSGSGRVLYSRLYINGAAGGDCLRAFTTVNSVSSTGRGAHISLSFRPVAGGSALTGLGTGLTVTTHIPDVASWAPTGTLYGAQVELWSDGAASNPSGLTDLAVLSLGNNGNATGRGQVDARAVLLHLTGWTAGATNVFSTGLTAGTVAGNLTASLKIKVGATVYYIPLATAIT